MLRGYYTGERVTPVTMRIIRQKVIDTATQRHKCFVAPLLEVGLKRIRKNEVSAKVVNSESTRSADLSSSQYLNPQGCN